MKEKIMYNVTRTNTNQGKQKMKYFNKENNSFNKLNLDWWHSVTSETN